MEDDARDSSVDAEPSTNLGGCGARQMVLSAPAATTASDSLFLNGCAPNECGVVAAVCPQPEGRRGVRLDVRVAVRLDSEMLLASVGPDVSELGRECLARGRV